MINLLIKHRSPINATDSAGQTPLHHAVAEGHGKLNPFRFPLGCPGPWDWKG
ncbi:hypothetical protein L209DRAFT_760056 [Thermothelomyces heterothallicus CBS 203.75]